MEGDVTNRKCSALTGSARKIKDNAADWHNLMLRWEKANDEGFAIATNIVNLRRSSGQTVEQSSSEQAAITAQLQQECGKLQDIVDKMAAILSKMQRLMASQRGLVELEDFQFGPEGRKVPLFHSWSTKHFEQQSGVLLKCFSEELRVKRIVQQEVAHSATPDQSLVYLSCWLHQPKMAAAGRVALEAMLLETGHRAL
ncbi:cyclin-dependent kinase 2-interacting protein [Nerophis ophidion]|uniref:cyclin-dependent kinase 2-interacting protein n=1 Tax=Nerophis ophidion TaxID=159077 RepID=UPI002ADF3860|nr:cyclin-dependent kinase 2-interacting protein [Nerophis ophidion]